MKIRFARLTVVARWFAFATAPCLLLPACASNLPTLVEVARARQNPPGEKNKPDANYAITDRDVLDYTDRLKLNLSHHFQLATGARYGSTAGQTTLAALAGAASVAGWGVVTASGLGQGSAFVGGLGQIFDAKGDAQAYETAFVAIQRAEANFYFFQIGGKFVTDDKGKIHAVFPATPRTIRIPSTESLSGDGETLYYRAISVLKVLDDALARKIPDLQTLKDANGDSSVTVAPAAAH